MDNAVLPFGMTWDRETFRIVRALTKAVFEPMDALITLMRDGVIWRSVDPEGKLPQRDRAGSWVIESGEAMWFEDVTLVPELADGPMVVAAPFIRFYAAAPIVLSDGSVLGALCVVDDKPRPMDERLMARLKDLAKILANDCDSARHAQELAEGGRKLKAVQNVVNALTEVMPVSIFMTDKDMKVIDGSSRWFQSTGHTRESAIGRSLYDLGDYERHRPAYEECLTGKTRRVDGLKWTRPDGEERYLKSELAPWRNAEGEISGVTNVLLDITDLYTAKRRAEEAETRMTLAAAIANLKVWELDYENRRLVIGDGSAGVQMDIYGREYTFEELAPDTDITIHPDDRLRISEEWNAAVMADRPYTPEYRINRPDNKEVWVTCGVKLIRNKEGRALRLIGALQDITDRKKAEMALVHAKEEAEAANIAKSAFLATMSHEIRTPLNGVLGMAQALEAEALEPGQREKLSIIRQSGESLLAILNDVLDLSKIEAGKLELEEATFDIGDVAKGALATFTELANRKGLEFNLTVAPDARGAYVGNSTRVRQILYNLVSNAVKFTEEGEVLVMVGRDESGLSICVSDTGIGVAQDRLEKLFDKFEQADASTTRRFGGTGLGLSICRQLVELMGGAVSVSSEVGRGTTFEVRLPLRWVGELSGMRSVAEPERAEATLDPGELRVLAAEDNAVNQLVLKTLMAQAGVDVTVVDNGALALEAWRRSSWDVILMDVQMPVMDGPTATRMIREEECATGRARTPIVALTANAMAHQVAEYRSCGMDDFVAKPIEIGLLFAALERCLEAGDGASDRMAG